MYFHRILLITPALELKFNIGMSRTTSNRSINHTSFGIEIPLSQCLVHISVLLITPALELKFRNIASSKSVNMLLITPALELK